MTTAKRIRVLLAEDNKLVRSSMRSLLEREGDIEVLGEARTGREAVDLAKRLCPAVIVMDISMPQFNGVEATRQILQTIPGIKVLILSAHDDDVYVDYAMESGAVGYLVKLTSGPILVQAIREVQRGNTFLCPEVAKSFRIRFPG